MEYQNIMASIMYLALSCACALVALLLCLNAEVLGNFFKLMDVPEGRKQHKLATPLMGGIVVLFAFIPFSLLYVLFALSDRWTGTLLIWLTCVAVMAFVGLADDRHSLSPRLRLLISFLTFASAATFDPTFNVRVLDFAIPRFTLGLGTWWLAVIFTSVCCVGLINAINMADGKNGLVLGLSLGWLGILAMRAAEPLLPLIALMVLSLAILFVFNLRGRLFLGDGGAYAIACAIGLLSIMVYNTPGTYMLRAISADELVALFAVPVFDSFRLTFTRLREGRSPMSADRNHLHHHLQDKFGWPQGLIIYWAFALTPATLLIAVRIF
ncbi:MAG: undecaprenyl/decaprenyl-phosphate alpha-N-acetylglucosaminyl 1-phosphate transferase [Sphingomonadaceae bacterium]|nr:undecaprenyl/decaprenyl-phosphate alpha-N-acetylglucosaminyl 1-phosphate transferase [Sphingomonadaceae bacterium]